MAHCGLSGMTCYTDLAGRFLLIADIGLELHQILTVLFSINLLKDSSVYSGDL
jgi:hypothetical protein